MSATNDSSLTKPSVSKGVMMAVRTAPRSIIAWEYRIRIAIRKSRARRLPVDSRGPPL